MPQDLAVEGAEQVALRDDAEELPACPGRVDDRQLPDVAEPELLVDGGQRLLGRRERDLGREVLGEDEARELALLERLLDVVDVDGAEQPALLVADVEEEAPRAQEARTRSRAAASFAESAATSRRMMSETLRLASAVASGVFSQTMPAERRLADVHRLLLEAARAVVTARTETTIIGSSTAVFCVSSKIMITASSGARVTPASRPAHAEQRVAADRRVERGRHGVDRASRRRRRRVAPTSSDGVKTPPTPPGADRRRRRDHLAGEEQEREEQRSGCREGSDRSPRSRCPTTCGSAIAIPPTTAPPSAIVAQIGSRVAREDPLAGRERAARRGRTTAPPSEADRRRTARTPATDSRENGATW